MLSSKTVFLLTFFLMSNLGYLTLISMETSLKDLPRELVSYSLQFLLLESKYEEWKNCQSVRNVLNFGQTCKPYNEYIKNSVLWNFFFVQCPERYIHTMSWGFRGFNHVPGYIKNCLIDYVNVSVANKVKSNRMLNQLLLPGTPLKSLDSNIERLHDLCLLALTNVLSQEEQTNLLYNITSIYKKYGDLYKNNYAVKSLITVLLDNVKPSHFSPFFQLLSHGNLDEIKRQLNDNPLIAHTCNEFGENGLIRSVKLNRYDISQCIVENSTLTPDFLNATDLVGSNVLECGQPKHPQRANFIKVLFEKCPDFFQNSPIKSSFLISSIEWSDRDLINLLLQRTRLTDQRLKSDYTLLELVTLMGRIDIVKKVVNYAQQEENFDYKKELVGPFLKACTKNLGEIVDFLITLHQKNNFLEDTLEKAAHIVVAKGNHTVLKVLIEKKLIDCTNQINSSLLKIALENKQLECLRILLANKIPLNNEALMRAIDNNFLEGVKELLTYKPTLINDKSDRDYTPLMKSVKECEKDLFLVDFLLKNKADVTITTGDGQTVFNIAENKGYPKIMELLAPYKPKEFPKKRNKSPVQDAFMNALRHNNYNEAERLLGLGAQVLYKDENDETPLYIVVNNKNIGAGIDKVELKD